MRLLFVASWALRVGDTIPGAGDIEMLRKHASAGLDEGV